MSSPVRRPLKELRTLYKLHPDFRDVYVEGRDDVALIRWYLSHFHYPSVKVFAVDDRADIPREIVEPVHAEINARGRLVALASAANEWALPSNSVTCVIDSDFDRVLNTDFREYPALLRTDYASMEVYTIQDRPLTKFLVAAAKSEVSASDARTLLNPIWASIYALRYVLHYHTDGAKLVDKFAEKCLGNTGEVILDVRALLRTSSQGQAGDTLDELMLLHAKYLAQITVSNFEGIRGHDIAPILVRLLGLKNEFASVKVVEGLLRQSLEFQDLDDQGLFTALRGRLT